MEALSRIELRPKRIALPSSVTKIDIDELHRPEFPTATLYSIRAQLGMDIMIEKGADEQMSRDYQARHARCAIASEVFCEVKKKLREQFAETSTLKHRVSVHDREAFDAVVRLERAISEAIDMMTPQ